MRFSQSGTFNIAAKDFISKGVRAIQSSIDIINRLKVTNSSVPKKLFEALVSSTALYAAPVWCLGHTEELEKIQSMFFRKLLCVLQCTPGYAIRVEMNITSLELKCFKLILNFIQRILRMKNNRFPKICFEKLKSLSEFDTNKQKYNWFVHVRNNFFSKINQTDTWDNLTLDLLEKEKKNLIIKMENQERELDAVSSTRSTSLLFFPAIHQIERAVHYFDLTISLYYKKVIAQLILFNKYAPRFITKNKYFINEKNTVNTVMKIITFYIQCCSVHISTNIRKNYYMK